MCFVLVLTNKQQAAYFTDNLVLFSYLRASQIMTEEFTLPALRTPWIEYFDEETKSPYYFNYQSRENTRELPEEYLKWKEESLEMYLRVGNWRKAKNDKGRVYFYNRKENITQWNPPNDFENRCRLFTQSEVPKQFPNQVQPEASAEDDDHDQQYDEDYGENGGNDVEYQAATPESGDKDDESDYHDDDNVYPYDEYKLNEDDDVGKVTLQRESSSGHVTFNNDSSKEEGNHDEEIAKLTSILSKRDSIMEPDVVQTTKRLRLLCDEDPITTVTRLSDNYVGCAAKTNIICEWLILAKSLNRSSMASVDVQSTYDQMKKEVENLMVAETAKLVKQRYDRRADDIILHASEIPSWLVAMMNDDIFRKTLIQLYDTHNDSALLGFALRRISKLGYHREIAHVIREFEYLEVLNDILVDMLSQVRSSSFSST